jgi:stearoyl-CoA desaturase (delta-9 desaturase)
LRYAQARDAVKHWLQRDAVSLPSSERAILDQVLLASPVLGKIYALREELSALWKRSSASKEQLLTQLDDWSRRAEASGIRSLQEFSRMIRCYAA